MTITLVAVQMVGAFIGVCLLMACCLLMEERAAQQDRCGCRRSVHTFLAYFWSRHPRARWFLILGVGWGVAYVPISWLADRHDLVWVHILSWGFSGSALHEFANFVWHEWGRWRRGLRAAARKARAAFTVRKVATANL